MFLVPFGQSALAYRTVQKTGTAAEKGRFLRVIFKIWKKEKAGEPLLLSAHLETVSLFVSVGRLPQRWLQYLRFAFNS